MARVFVSHAAKDKPLVEKLTNLLCLGTGVPANKENFFCSSINGIGIPPGVKFVEHVKSELNDAELVIILLSPNYLSSQFCLCEMGVAWAAEKKQLVLKMPDLDFGELSEIISRLQITDIKDKQGLTSLRSQMIEGLRIKDPPEHAFWEKERDRFCSSLTRVLNKLPKPENISRDQFDQLNEKYKRLLSETDAFEARIEEKDEQIEQLKKCKDAEEVASVTRSFSSATERFQELCAAVKNACSQLAAEVLEAAYQELNGLSYSPSSYQMQGVNSAIQDGLLYEDAEGLLLNQEDPKVSRLIEKLEELRSFLSDAECKHDPEEFIKIFVGENDYNPEFKTRRMWEDHLGLSSHTKWTE